MENYACILNEDLGWNPKTEESMASSMECEVQEFFQIPLHHLTGELVQTWAPDAPWQVHDLHQPA